MEDIEPKIMFMSRDIPESQPVCVSNQSHEDHESSSGEYVCENNIVIYLEFKDFLPPLSDVEYNTLKESIRTYGCRDRGVAWKKDGKLILLDGHHRLEICQGLGIPFPEPIGIELPSNIAAMDKMLEIQTGRRSLNDFQKIEVAMKFKKAIQKDANERKIAGKKAEGRPIHTHVVLAERVDVSPTTMQKGMYICENGDEDLKRRLRDREGKLSIHGAYKELRKLSHSENPESESEDQDVLENQPEPADSENGVDDAPLHEQEGGTKQELKEEDHTTESPAPELEGKEPEPQSRETALESASANTVVDRRETHEVLTQATEKPPLAEFRNEAAQEPEVEEEAEESPVLEPVKLEPASHSSNTAAGNLDANKGDATTAEPVSAVHTSDVEFGGETQTQPKGEAEEEDFSEPECYSGQCEAIICDPPIDGPRGNYSVCDVADQLMVPIKKFAADDSILFLWLDEDKSKEGLELIEACGFAYAGTIQVYKETPGTHLLSRTPTSRQCLVAKRGNPKPLKGRLTPYYDGPMEEDGRKPVKFYEIVSHGYAVKGKLDIFPDKKRPGWLQWAPPVESEQAEAGPEQTAPEEDFLETNAMKDSFRDLDEANLEIGQQVFASAPKNVRQVG